MAENNEQKIFKLNRLKFKELYQDALDYIKASYKAADQDFNTASPFGQLLKVILHLGRMIFYYIEDSISGLNIRTAYRPDQVKGLAMLAGHDSSRPIAARGAIKLTYYGEGNQANEGNMCYIPNKTVIKSLKNGLDYVILFGAANARVTMRRGNYVEANVIQGEIKMQSATGTGEQLQSFNFAERNYAEVDQYYVNVYVNSEPWEIVSSIIDLGFNQKGCVLRTGINSGIDIFFGNGIMGAIPEKGASIVVEYCVTNGANSNLFMNEINQGNGELWEFQGTGMMVDGTTINLQKNFKVTMLSDIIFGTYGEDTILTQLIAPHVSRSFVLANEVNYRYFFKRMNMFSDIEIIRGSYNVNGTPVMQLAYDESKDKYQAAKTAYDSAVNTYGINSKQAKLALVDLEKAQSLMNYTKTKLTDNTYQDNTIYLLLIPDIKKRISSEQNYFNCEESLFYLSKDEQENILNLINASGQRIITVENKIIQPKVVRFSINVEAKIWEEYELEDVYYAGLEAVSNYLLNYDRKDMIPVSDIVSIFENNVEGIDSVKVWFDADKNNKDIYGNGFDGIDDFGDIILTRKITDAHGQVQQVRDIMPLIRGGFISDRTQINYTTEEDVYTMSAFNIRIDKNKSKNRNASLSRYSVNETLYEPTLTGDSQAAEQNKLSKEDILNGKVIKTDDKLNLKKYKALT